MTISVKAKRLTINHGDGVYFPVMMIFCLPEHARLIYAPKRQRLVSEQHTSTLTSGNIQQ